MTIVLYLLSMLLAQPPVQPELGSPRSQLQSATLKNRIEPQPDPKLSASPVDPINVEITIDETGIPEKVITSPGLPDAVVRAIAAARFNPATEGGKPVPTSTRLSIPIHRELEYFYRVKTRPSTGSPDGLMKSVSEGMRLSPAAASEVEKKLIEGKDSIPSRSALIGFASANVGAEFRQLHRRQIAWMVRNSPESAVLGSPSSMLYTEGTLRLDPEGYREVRSLWLDQLTLKPADPVIIGHASYFFRISDRETAEKILLGAMPNVSGASGWLGELYALSALGVTTLDYASGMPLTTGLSLPDTGFAKHAQTELLNTSDARIVMAALATVTSGGRNLQRLSYLPEGFGDFCEMLRSRAKSFGSKNVYSCDVTPIPPNPVATGPLKPGKLKKQPNPKFPSEARKRQIEGSLEFMAIIGEDGRIKSLDLIKGPLVFYPSARETIFKWEYEPSISGGSPVEVYVVITVNYDLKRKN